MVKTASSSASIHARAGLWRVGWRRSSSASNVALDVAIVVELLSPSTASSVASLHDPVPHVVRHRSATGNVRLRRRDRRDTPHALAGDARTRRYEPGERIVFPPVRESLRAHQRRPIGGRAD
eukprot:3916421-Pleurochrysis_carterae.AAC.1